MLNRLASGLAFPEGPAFTDDGALWVVELRGRRLTRIDGKESLSLAVDGAPNGLAIDAAGQMVVCDADNGRLLRVRAGEMATLVGSDMHCRLDRPNDLAFDGRGNLVFTCPGNSRREPNGTVWVLKSHGALAPLSPALQFPNGVAFSSDGHWLYVAETYRQRIWRGGWSSDDCRWREPKPFAEVGGAVGPDGLAVGADGTLYAAIYGDGVVRAVDDNGTVIAEHRLPGANPTNCAFDPSGPLGLVVTEAERGEIWSLPALGRGAPLGYKMGEH